MRPPFDPAAASLSTMPDLLATFRDRYETPPPANPIRPARYEGSKLWLMRIEPTTGPLQLHWPATCCARTVDLVPGGPVDTLLELSLMPFAHREMLTAIPGGVPTFYLGYDGPPFPDDNAVKPSDEPVTLTGSAWFGILFQDRLAMAPWAWFDRIAAAPGAEPAWRVWAEKFSGRRGLRLLDAQGRPFAAQTIALTRGGQTVTAVSDEAGALGNLPLQGTISWQPSQANATLPMMALCDTPLANLPGENSLALPDGFAGGHLQLLALSNWFAPNLHEDPLSPLPGARFRTKSRFEPLVDGEETFARLLEDLEAAKGAGGAAYFAGWAFSDFPLRPGDEATRLLKIAEDIEDVRILAAQLLQASDEALDSLSTEAGLLFLILLVLGSRTASVTYGTGYTSTGGLAAWLVIAAAATFVYATKLGNGEKVGKAIRAAVEQTSPEFRAELAGVCRAVYAPHPVTVDDNPLASDIPLPDGRQLRDLQDRWGVFHDKIQLVKRAAAGPDRYSAYLGGVEIYQNRLDSPGHHGAAWREPESLDDPVPGSYHDVHCRLTGAAAAEVFHVFRGRDALAPPPSPPDPPRSAEPTVIPTPEELGETGRDVIQVAQTSYGPRIAGTGLPWAPDGNATIHNSLVSAIEAAREYIYIEEQYMVPGQQYMNALIGAAPQCRRLIILLPAFLEVVFGDTKRGEFFRRLSDAWGSRLFIGTPVRRPVLSAPGRVTSKGRLSLVEDIGESSGTILVGPPARVPSGRFFLWIEGELMYALKSTTVTHADGPAKELQVLRGGNGTATRWCSDPRPHRRGAPVTASQPTSIFVHGKVMIVDDLFVAIGSTNLNRRGFFHDGEIHAFAIPEELRNAPANPARDLRTRLWGEQLGLSPAMGATLLRDPIAGFELFTRSRYEGNRVVPLSELAVPTPTLDDLPEIMEMLPLALRTAIHLHLQITLEMLAPLIFDTLADPTTTLETAA